MRRGFVILLLVFLGTNIYTVSLGSGSRSLCYSLSTTIDISPSQNKVVISPDLSFAILHGSHFNQPTLLSPLNWTPMTLSNSNFSFPTYIDYYTDINNTSNIIYGNFYGYIVAKNFVDNQLKDQVVFNIPDYLKFLEIKIVVISDDGMMWATTPTEGSIVYVGDYAGIQMIGMFQLKNSTVRDLAFRPGAYQVIISAGDWSKNVSSLSGHDIIHNKNYSYPIADQGGIIMKVSYASENIFYALQEQHVKQEIKKYVKRYNHQTRQVVSYEAPFDVVDLECKGKFIEFRDRKRGQKVYKITEQLFSNESLLYDGDNELEGSTISPDGSHLLRKANQSSLQILKLCNIPSHFYQSSSSACIACQSPCLDCIFSSSKCTSCLPEFEFNSEAQRCQTPERSYLWVIIVTVGVVFGLMAVFGVLIARHIRKRKIKDQMASTLLAEERDERKDEIQ